MRSYAQLVEEILDGDPLITPAEADHLLGTPNGTAEELYGSGDLHGIQIGDVLRFRRSAVEARKAAAGE